MRFGFPRSLALRFLTRVASFSVPISWPVSRHWQPGGSPERIGLVNTMVFTHLPSNVLLMLVPLMPTAWLAVAVLLLRFSISQMDVPTRPSYTMAVVSPDERSAASGVTSVARSIGASISPMLAATLVGTSGWPAFPSSWLVASRCPRQRLRPL